MNLLYAYMKNVASKPAKTMEVAPQQRDLAQATFPSLIHLESSFLYQNNLTGQVSTTPLTLRQLCRILCPAAVALSHQQPTLKHLTADTNVLLQEPDGTFCTGGWKPARDVPILRDAITPWYYYRSSNNNTVDEASTAPSVGPALSCRALAALIKQRPDSSSMHFSSSLTNSEWKTLDQLPNLRTALDCFDELLVSKLTLETLPRMVQGDAAEVENHSAKQIQLELEAFLVSTAGTTDHGLEDDGDDEDECYESDDGTRYVKDVRTGNWVHEALVAASNSKHRLKQKESSKDNRFSTKVNDVSEVTLSRKRKQKKSKFSAKKGRCWIYVTGLPADCTETEVATRFAKAGLLDLDPETQAPKVKLYRYKEADTDKVGTPKGDASICYARPESVALAVTLLDGTSFRATAATTTGDSVVLMTVQAAKFEQHGDQFDGGRGRISNAKRKVAKLATMQAMDWDDGEFNGRLTGGRKGLRIVVLKHIFDPKELKEASEEVQDRILGALEQDLGLECKQWGVVEKLTFFSEHPEGVAVVKFTQPGSASDTVKEMNGRLWKERRIEAYFWDGVTDFTTKNETQEAKDRVLREEEFGNWLESQELPEELRLHSG